MASKGLSDNHTLVAVSCGKPSGIKRKRAAARELAEQKGSDKRRTKVMVDTFRELVADIGSNNQGGRDKLVSKSLLFGEKGYRLVPNEILADLLAELRGHEIENDRLAREAADLLPAQIKRDRKELGDLFDEADYPDRETFISKCRFKVDLAVVPDPSQDVRAGFSPEHQERMRETVQRQNNEKVKAAVDDLVGSIVKEVEKIIDRTAKYTGKREGSFRDTLTQSARSFADLLKHANITNDPAIEDVRQRLLRDICPVDAQDLRDDPELRKKVNADASEIRDILRRVGQFGK